MCLFFSSRRRHTRCALVTGVQTCALPICPAHGRERPMNNLVPLRRAEPAWTDQLRTEGYCIIPDALPVGAIAALETDLDPVFAATPFCRGRFYGERTKRFGSLLKRSPHAAQLVLNPMILSMVEEILVPACDRIQLNVAQAIRSEEHTSELQSLMRISYAILCLTKNRKIKHTYNVRAIIHIR